LRRKTQMPANNTHTQPFYGSVEFVWDNLGEPVPEETFTQKITGAYFFRPSKKYIYCNCVGIM